MKGSWNALKASLQAGCRTIGRHGSLWLVALLTAAAILAGCHGDPNVRKQKYFESGMRYSSQGQFNEAAIQFANALKVDNEYGDAHYELAKAYLHLGQFGAAYQEFSHTVDLQPANWQARLDFGSLLLAGGRDEDAQIQAKAVMALQPNNPDAHALLSGIAIKAGHREVALTEIQRALQLDPNRATFHEDLAILQESDPSQASGVESELKKSVAIDPQSVTARLLLAAFYTNSSRWPEAEETSWGAVAADPKSLEARQGMAQIFLREGEPAKAEQVLRQAAHDLKDNPRAVGVVADFYERIGQLDKARAEFASLSAQYPNDLPLQEGYVRSLLQVNDYASARSVIAGLMKKHAKDPHVLALNGIVLLNNGMARDAVNALESAARDYPRDAFIQLWRGRAALATGDVALAEKSFRQAEELSPSRLEAHQELADLAVRLGDMDLLSDVADRTIAVAPHLADAYVWRALAESSHNAAGKAEADLKIALEIAPQSALASLQLAKLRFAQRKFQEGINLLEQALQYDPDSAEALRLIASFDLYQKQPEKALKRVNEQIARSPKNSGFYDLLAQLQMQRKNLDQAAVSAQKAIAINPADPEAVMLLAQVEVQRGQAARAIAAWQQWSNAHPTDAASYAILGTLEESRGNSPQAETDYKQSLQIQPQQPLAANNLAYLMLQNGQNPDVALSLAQIARRAMPNSPNTADTLAWAYYTKGAYGFARDLLEEELKSDANNATMQYHLGMVYSKLGDKSDAAAHLRKAVSLAPDSPSAKNASAALQGLG